MRLACRCKQGEQGERHQYHPMPRPRFFDDEGGFTSLGVVVAMLLAVALVCSSARVYWVQSRAADVQFAADAGALASEEVIADYLTCAHVADAIVLSMSLLGLTLYGVSAAAACIPVAGAEIATGVSNVARSVMRARDKFSDAAVEALDDLQRALPFLCMVNALTAIQANGAASGQSSLVGLAVPVPLTGSDWDPGTSESVEQVGDKADEVNAETAQLSTTADEAARRMEDALIKAYQADCGANPGYCLYQRTATLSAVPASSNPYYSSPEGWTFSVPLARARAYYTARLAAEPGRNGGGDFSNPEEAVRSIARARFYAFALERLRGATVAEVDGAVVVNLPLLPANTDDVRATSLYTEAVWPVTQEDGKRVLHASWSCPRARTGQRGGYGSVAQLESGALAECPVCRFSVSTLGYAPAASTSIDNGFEHHWRIIAEQSGIYAQAAGEYEQQAGQARRNVEEVLDLFGVALDELAATRYDPQPPGRYGSIAIVIDPAAHRVPLFGPLSGGEAQIGARVAVSAATLAPDDPTYADNLISSLLSSVSERAASQGSGTSSFGLAIGTLLAGIVDVWGRLLLAYCQGSDALVAGLGNALDKIPFAGDRLSQWATSRLREVIELLGLQPCEMALYKPVLCNSVHIVDRADSRAASALGTARSVAAASGSTGFAGILSWTADTMDEAASQRLREGIELHLRLVDAEGFPTVPITVTLPPGLVSAGEGAVGALTSRLRAWSDALEERMGVWR